jgi:F-box protein 28
LSVLRNELRTVKRKDTDRSKQMAEQQKLIAEQQKNMLEYANRLDENDKKTEEISRKYSTMLQVSGCVQTTQVLSTKELKP